MIRGEGNGNMIDKFNPSELSPGIDQKTLERLAHLFGLCLYTVNLDTGDIQLNLNTTRITGHDPDSLPNTDNTKESMIYQGDRGLVNGSLGEIIGGKRDHYHIEYRMHRRDSSIVWIDEVGLISGYNQEGRPLYMSAMSADMSRLRWAEDKARSMESEVRRLTQGTDDNTLAEENRLLRAANTAAAIIIGGFHQDYETVLHEAVQLLGESLGANYAGIWRNVEREGALCCFLRTHWTEEGRTVGAENNRVYMKYDDFLPGWKERLAEKQFVACDSSGLSDVFKQESSMGEAKSFMLAPFYLHGEFWGMIGFTRRERIPFTAYEAETIMSGALIVACSVARNETFGKLNMDRDKAIADTMAKGEFLSRMSHEMRTPLNAVIGMTSIALKEQNPQKVAGYLKKIETSSHLLLHVINDVLDMSKIEAGKLELAIEPFDFAAMMKTAENIVQVKMDEKSQRFTVNCDSSMTRMVHSDEQRLLQVIVNLLNNAAKFTPENGAISLTAVQKKIAENRVKLRVEVRDSGIGLTPEQQKRLFTAFEQADGSITRKYGGTGLGLAICKKLLNALGGDIWVKSKPNQGACFLFELEADLGEPVAALDDSGETASGASAPSGADRAAPPNWKGRTILLAEDVEINREIVETMLEETGVCIHSVENGKEAVEFFSANPEGFDLILMDVQMPVLDGLSATKRIRVLENPRAAEVPIIAMTANAFKEDIDLCIRSGMNGHIPKPFDPDILFETLNKYLL
ncbi:hypothetical protein AGMMS50230_00450 [Spirochaetia bacterium]|nr:hypothetical protein AGMMS50230_00450 [Spirochaetia bacterium]